MKITLLNLLLLLFAGVTAWGQGRVVTGKVTSSDDGSALPGVNVIVQGTTKGTTTDVEGIYSIELAEEENTLVFTYVGYKTFNATVGTQTTVDVVLEADVTALSEVVVIGYGVAKKSDVTGAMATVKGSDLSRIASANPSEALQGKVAGVAVTTNSTPGKGPTVRVRGLGSVSSKTDPLYVVDGVLVDDITFLGNDDIQSINILKDASASAIYGIRASNGVVIITTKRGNKDEPRLTYSGYVGVQRPINVVDMVSGPEYIELLNEKGVITATRPNNGPFLPWDPANYPYSTDWYDKILRSNALIQSHDVTASGGNDKTQFSFGAGYFSQEGLAKKTDYQRINLKSSVESQVAKFLKVGLSANLSNSRTNNAPAFLFNAAYVAPPATSQPGDLAPVSEFGNFSNPVAMAEYNNDEIRGIRLVGGVFAEAYIAKGLTFKSFYGVDGSYNRNRKYIPWYWISELQKDTSQTLTQRIENFFNYYWDNTLTYNFKLGEDHQFTFLAGMNAQEQRYYALEGKSQGVVDYGKHTWYLPKGDIMKQATKDEGFRSLSLSYFGRLNYSFQERYLLTATLRRDGTSVFPANNRYDYFPSVGLGWILSNEAFMTDQNIFQYLKLRGSWGRMGNNRVPTGTAVSYVTTDGSYYTQFGNAGALQGASITIAIPPNLLWETTDETDVAIEGGVLQNRLTFEVDLYRRKTVDAIFPVTVNSSLGTTNTEYLDNTADVVNKGIEANVTWNGEVGEFKYSIGGVFAYNKNEVVALKDGTIGVRGGTVNYLQTTYTVLGRSVGEFYGRKVIGIFQNEAEVQAYRNADGGLIQPDARPGDFKYQDTNGNGSIDSNDRVFLGGSLPKYNFGITLSGQYKGFDLALDLYGQGGNKIYNARRFRQLGNENYDKDFYDNRWRGEGTSYTYPSADISNGENRETNSWFVESGSFFKIRNVQLGYTLPSAISSKASLSRVRVYANATNPLVLFSYSGFTPEIPTAIPTAQNAGNTSETLGQGVDTNVYPTAATFNLGVNITF